MYILLKLNKIIVIIIIIIIIIKKIDKIDRTAQIGKKENGCVDQEQL